MHESPRYIVLLALQADAELSALRFDDSGLTCAVGTSTGMVALFDLRSSRPMLIKDHMYGDKIIDIKFHQPALGAGSSQRQVISTGEGVENA